MSNFGFVDETPITMKRFLLLYILAILMSCTTKKTDYHGAIAITFDDHSIFITYILYFNVFNVYRGSKRLAP